MLGRWRCCARRWRRPAWQPAEGCHRRCLASAPSRHDVRNREHALRDGADAYADPQRFGVRHRLVPQQGHHRSPTRHAARGDARHLRHRLGLRRVDRPGCLASAPSRHDVRNREHALRDGADAYAEPQRFDVRHRLVPQQGHHRSPTWHAARGDARHLRHRLGLRRVDRPRCLASAPSRHDVRPREHALRDGADAYAEPQRFGVRHRLVPQQGHHRSPTWHAARGDARHLRHRLGL